MNLSNINTNDSNLEDTSPPETCEVTIWSLDVWGNQKEGYEVNDRCKVGTIEVTKAEWEDSDKLLDVLIAEGYLVPEAKGLADVDTSEVDTYINNQEGRPVFQLELA